MPSQIPTPNVPDRAAVPNLGDYAQGRAEYRVEVPPRFNPVVDIVDRWAAEDPEATALVSLGPDGAPVAEQTAADLADDSRRAARALLELGVKKGDRVFVMLPRVPAWYSAMLGAMRIGAVPSPAPNQSMTRDIAYRIDRLEAVVAITDVAGAMKFPSGLLAGRRLCWTDGSEPPAGWSDYDAALAAAGEVPLPEDPTAADDPLLVFFTSGTVSYPKMVQHRQSYALGHVGTARFWHDLRAGDRHWTISDTGWAKAAWGGMFGQWHERAAVVQVALGAPDPDLVLGIVAEHGITSFCAPPTIYRMLVHADFSAHDLSALRHCTSAGEPLNPEVIRAWREGTGVMVYDGYGQTETTVLVANYRSMEVRPGSMGKPVPGYEIEVHDPDGRPEATGVVGEIAVRADPDDWPAGLFSGYYGDEEATAAAIREGWYYTGDKAAVDADGYFWFEGRSDDVITSSAYRIGPFEVESALVEHSAVLEAAVVGKPDPERTEIVFAFVVLANGAEGTPELVAELQDHVKSTTAPYKYPRGIAFVEDLPKTISGKIRRGELRRRLQAGEGA